MPVILRKSKIKDGYSFYFDITYKGRRWTEWLKIRIKGKPNSEENKNLIGLAKKMQINREQELIVLGKGLPQEMLMRERDFFEVYDERVAIRNDLDSYVNIRKKLKKYVGNGTLPISAIDKVWMAGYLNFLKREKLGVNTIHQYFGFVGTVLREAMCTGYIASNPYDLFSKSERPKMKRPDAQSLSMEELDTLIKCKTKKIDDQLHLISKSPHSAHLMIFCWHLVAVSLLIG